MRGKSQELIRARLLDMGEDLRGSAETNTHGPASHSSANQRPARIRRNGPESDRGNGTGQFIRMEWNLDQFPMI